MSNETIVEAIDLTKFYGKRCGVEGITFRVQPGEVVGFLGPNGSGKTTVLRMLMGLISITRGQALLFGKDITTSSPSLRAEVGYLPGTLGLYEHLSAGAYFDFISHLRRRDCSVVVRQLCDRFSLDPALRIKTMSKGTKQKVGLIQAFMHQPQLLILDEPTSGLDPLVQHEFEHLLTETRSRGASVLLSSHILSEVEKLAGRVVILHHGQLLACESVDSLPGRQQRVVELEFNSPVDAVPFQNIDGFTLTSRNSTRVSGVTSGSQRALLETALQQDFSFMRSPDPSLDDLFRSLVESSNNRKTTDARR
jgi:ABC-2 type transport system ATP-binding protein